MLLLDECVDEMSDEALHARYLQDGCNDCITELRERFDMPMHGLLARSISAHDIEDVTQDVWLLVHLNGNQFDPDRGSFFNWVMKIAQNAARMHLREGIAKMRNNGEPEVSLDGDDGMGELEGFDSSIQLADRSEQTCLIDEMEKTLLIAQMRAHLEELPEDERQIIELVYFEGLTFRQAAARLGLSDAGRMYVSRKATAAIATLREKMGVVLEEAPV